MIARRAAGATEVSVSADLSWVFESTSSSMDSSSVASAPADSPAGPATSVTESSTAAV